MQKNQHPAHLVLCVLGEVGLCIAEVNGVLAWLPVDRAEFAVLVVVLESLNDAKNLLRVTASRGVVEGGVAEVALVINDVSSTSREALVLEEAAVVLGDLLAGVSEDRHIELAETTLLARLLHPISVRLSRVAGRGDDLTVEILESLGVLRHGDDLSGADEGEVLGVPEQDNILALVVGKLDFLRAEVREHSFTLELRSSTKELGLAETHVAAAQGGLRGEIHRAGSDASEMAEHCVDASYIRGLTSKLNCVRV